MVNKIFYMLKPVIPRSFQLLIRRRVAGYKRKKYSHIWPIDPSSTEPPAGWQGWPDNKRFALVLSHDVDTRKGYDYCLKLAHLEEGLGFRSSFNFVPERYGVISPDLVEGLKRRGFGIAVHGLKHDGKLFSSKEIFDERATRINSYMHEWGTRGFTAPSMLRRHEWMHALNMEYCVSTFDTDPFEPQPAGVGTIFPFWVSDRSPGKGFLELPYTLVQDFTLFVILMEQDIGLWKQKVDWIAEKGGMALLNSHPDYMHFGGGACGPEEYPVSHYVEFLNYLGSRYGGRYWHALPSEVARFWSVR
jgi:hypothetical protein